jgi:hypothetical protein
MLTKHHYTEPGVDIHDENSDIFKCCTTNPSDDPTCTDCCYDKWQDELKEVIQNFKREEERAIQAKKKFEFASEKSQRYKTWLDELNKAEELARQICYQLEIIASQSDKIWYNSIQAVKAIEILFCMLRDFYMQVDCIKKRYDILWICINSNNDPSLQSKDKGLLKCLTEYYKKLEEVIKTRDEIIKAIVEAVKISNLIRNGISTQDCPKDYDPCGDKRPCKCHDCQPGDIYYGFKTIICEWYCDFKCDEPCAEATTTKPAATGNANQNSQTTATTTDLCACECELEPVFEFPFCNNPYKNELEDCYEKADKEAKDAAENLMKANKSKEALLACKQSLEKAIAEADPKNRCK